MWLAAGQQAGTSAGCTALPGWLVSSGRGAVYAAALADRGLACHAPAHEAWHIPAAAGCSRILSWWVATACLFLAIIGLHAIYHVIQLDSSTVGTGTGT